MLSHGKLLEFDSPYALLCNSDSEFTSLIDQTGAAESEHLRTLAHLATLKVNFNTQNFNDLPSEDEETDLLMK